MCGRFVLKASLPDLARHFGLPAVPAPAELGLGDRTDLPARWNISPGTDILAVGLRDGRRLLRPLRWGLVPGWAKDPSVGNRLANARAEGIEAKPSFRAAFRKRRVLVPASGFYEWQATDARTKQPWFISARSGEPLAFAALWEAWRRPEDGRDPEAGEPETLRTVCLITTAPNATMWSEERRIHDRMPVILPRGRWDAWLAPETGVDELKGMLTPASDDLLQAWKVSRDVSRVANQGPGLIEPLEPEEASTAPEPARANSL